MYICLINAFKLHMKLVFLILVLSSFIFSTKLYKGVLCAHAWKVEYIKTIKGTNDPNSELPISEIHASPPLCGQIITFKENYTCQVQNKGQGGLSEVDKFNWSIDESGNLKFKNKDSQVPFQFILQVLSFNKDSIIFYSPAIGIESGVRTVTVYMLKSVTININK